MSWDWDRRGHAALAIHIYICRNRFFGPPQPVRRATGFLREKNMHLRIPQHASANDSSNLLASFATYEDTGGGGGGTIARFSTPTYLCIMCDACDQKGTLGDWEIPPTLIHSRI